MKTKDLTIQESFFHAFADATIVRGILRDGEEHRAGQHIVGWVPRATPEKLIAPRRYLDSASASAALAAALQEDEIPSALRNAKDWQKRRVYEWEDKLLVSQVEGFLDQRQARKLLQRISRDFGVPCPKLIWGDNANLSEYDEDSNEIFFRHRDKITLLHEMTHSIVNERLGDDSGPDHSPGFVWLAIELYHRYAGIDLAFLIQSAAHRDILGNVIATGPDISASKKPDIHPVRRLSPE